MRSLLIAIGGNSLIRPGERGTVEEQRKNASKTAQEIVKCLDDGWRVVITHGNGPQVGAALLRSERSGTEVYKLPLDVCVALTQSEIGYYLHSALEQELRKKGIRVPVTTVPTQVEVRSDDPAFEHPTKPVGPFYSAQAAEEKRRTCGWTMVEDAARGYRRVVPSPMPVNILELEIIRHLQDAGVLVIAVGGGGIPVIVGGDKSVRGVEAVIDKDRASALLATELGVESLLISTDVEGVFLNHRKASQRFLKSASVAQLRGWCSEGHFPPGSMKPKIESAIQFLERGGKEVIIAPGERMLEALRGHAGTRITKDKP